MNDPLLRYTLRAVSWIYVMDLAAPPGPNHHYTFELYALDTKLDLAADATRADAMKAMDGYILGAAVFVTLFHR